MNKVYYKNRQFTGIEYFKSFYRNYHLDKQPENSLANSIFRSRRPERHKRAKWNPIWRDHTNLQRPVIMLVLYFVKAYHYGDTNFFFTLKLR